MTSDDHLRQRTAQALSQIFVVSEKSNLQLSGPGLADYYDVLYKNAFGNFRDILYEVSLHPMMGYYLSHLDNPKADPANNIHPDENYAREIMQLFSIGLSAPGYYWPWEDYSSLPPEFGNKEFNSPISTINWEPMVAFENQHEQGVKNLLNGQVVPAGQTTLEDINDAIDNLFNHPNVGPFIGKLLIQRLVKSNPSPAYVARVAAKFNDNGVGVRGDMEAFISAILTDAEALDCSWQDNAHHGKLRAPLLRYTQAMRAFNAQNQSGRMWNWGYLFEEAVDQGILASPSVFNFYLPEFQPNGPISDADLVAPEYQIHTSATSINFINLAYDWFIKEYYMEIATHAGNDAHNAPSYNENDLDPVDYVFLDLTDEIEIANDPAALVERLNLIMTGGAFSEATKTNIINAITPLSSNNDRVKAALYLAFISPDYSIQK